MEISVSFCMIKPGCSDRVIQCLLPCLLSEGLCTKLCPSRESAGGKQPPQEQGLSLPTAEGGWTLLEQADCHRRGSVQVMDRKRYIQFASAVVKFDSEHISSCYVQLPQPRVCRDGWDNGGDGADQSVLQPCGPEPATGGSGTRSAPLHLVTFHTRYIVVMQHVGYCTRSHCSTNANWTKLSYTYDTLVHPVSVSSHRETLVSDILLLTLSAGRKRVQ